MLLRVAQITAGGTKQDAGPRGGNPIQLKATITRMSQSAMRFGLFFFFFPTATIQKRSAAKIRRHMRRKEKRRKTNRRGMTWRRNNVHKQISEHGEGEMLRTMTPRRGAGRRCRRPIRGRLRQVGEISGSFKCNDAILGGIAAVV